VKEVRESGFADYQLFDLPSPPPDYEEDIKAGKKRRLQEPMDQVHSTGRSPAAQERTRSYLRQGADR
jgi:hypothetical protein